VTGTTVLRRLIIHSYTNTLHTGTANHNHDAGSAQSEKKSKVLRHNLAMLPITNFSLL